MSETLFRPGENCCAAGQADRVAFLVDGEEYFEAFAQAAERAERSILILAWDFDSRATLRFNSADGTALATVGEFLNGLCEKNPKLRIRILDWDFPMVYGTDREYSPIFGLEWKPHRHIDFRFDDTHPLAGSHHQKIVVIDDKLAFAGGLDLTNKRWDSRLHTPDDPRRTFQGEGYPPFHDAMIAVDGEAARELAALARSRWQSGTRSKVRAVKTGGDPWPGEMRVDIDNVPVGIACTRPAVNGDDPVYHVETLYLDMIRGAKKYIYIENQYFTSEKVGKALEERLGDPDGPEIVVVTRLLSHGWLEEMTMHVLRTRLVRSLRAADKYGKFHCYFPHVEGLCEGNCIDLHSKVMVVDDEWLRIGSSNISNRSMAVDTECDVAIEARGEKRVAAAIRTFRDRLLAEHSGVPIEQMVEALEKAPSMSAAAEAIGTPGRQLRTLEAPEVSDALIAAASIGDMEKPISIDQLMHGLRRDEGGARAKPKRSALWMFAGMVLAVASLALVWRYTPLADVVTAENVVEFTQSFSRYWWPPVLLVLAYTPASMVMFPRPLITLAAVVTFGPWEGIAYAMTGVVLAGVAGYGLGRMVHRDTVRRIAGPRLNRLGAVLKRRGIIAVALVRLVPVAPYVVVNVVMGAMHIKLRDFVIGTFLGMLPGAMAATVLSDQLAAALQDPSRVNGWVIAAAVCVLAALAYLGHRMLGRMEGGGGKGGPPPHSFA